MNSQGQTENLGQIAVLWISAYQPENNKLIWYDTISRIHKVYETSTGNWVPLNPQIVTNATLDDVRTQAQHYGLSIGKFYYLTDVGSLAVAVSVTKIWYVDSNGNYIVNDLISTVQAYVNSDNLLIDGTKGVYDLVTGKLVFAFTTIENGELADENNDYIAMRRKNGSVWSWIKLRLKNLISGENGNNITWNKGLYFSLLNSLREIVNHQGGVVGYDSYQSDKQQMTNSINQIAESNRTVLNAAKQYTDQETAAAKIYGKKHSSAWNVVNNPPNTPNAAATLEEILQILVSWTNVLQKAGKIGLDNDFAAAGKTGDISSADSVKSAIEKLIYKNAHLLDTAFINIPTTQNFSLGNKNVYMIGNYPAEFRILNTTMMLDVTVDDEDLAEGKLGIISRDKIGVILTGYSEYKLYLRSADIVMSVWLWADYGESDYQLFTFNMMRASGGDYSKHKFTSTETNDIQQALNNNPGARGVYLKILVGDVDHLDSLITTGKNIYFGVSGNGHPQTLYRYSALSNSDDYTYKDETAWDYAYDGIRALWGTEFIPSGFITQKMLHADSVASAQIEDDSVDTNHIIDEAITWNKIKDGAVISDKLDKDALIYDIRNAMGTGGRLPLGKIYMYDKWILETRMFSDDDNHYIVFGFPRGDSDDDSTPYPYPSMLFVFMKSRTATYDYYVFANSFDFDFAPAKFTNLYRHNVEDGEIVTSKISDGAVTNQKILDGTITNDKMATSFKNTYQIRMRFQDYNGNTIYPVRDFKAPFTFEPIAGEENLYKAIIANSSDIRLKENRKDLKLTSGDIAKMSAISFNFINDKEKEIHVGTIAQEWEKILPEVVRKGMDGYLSMDYSATALVSAIVLAREVEKQKDEIRVLKETIKTIQGN